MVNLFTHLLLLMGDDFVIGVDEQDVLRLQIRVRQVVVM